MEEFFHESLGSDDGETADDFFYWMFSDDGTSLDVEDTVDEDTDFHVGNHTKRRQSQVAPRKLRRLNQHPYAPPGSPVSPGEPINARLPGPDPTCPRNGRRLHASQV